MRRFAALLLASGLFAAGPSGPIAGLILDNRTGSIRAVTGTPGASRLAEPVILPFSVRAAEFTSSGSTALVITGQQPGHLAVIGSLLSGSPAVVDLGEVADSARILSLNAQGNAALVYSVETQQLFFVTGLDRTPDISQAVSTGTLAGQVTAGALDASGLCAVLGTGSVETLCSDGSSRRLLSETTLNITALALANGARDLWIADAAAKQVLRLADYAGNSSQPTRFASADDGLLRPIALAVSSTGQVILADSEASAVFVIEPLTESVRAIPLDITPSQLRPLTDKSLLLLNDLSALPFTLFATEAMRTYFVPAN